MSRSGLGYKVANKTYEYFTGSQLSEADEFEVEQFKAARETLGGMALTLYGCALEGVASGVEGDVLGTVPVVVGMYFFSKGIYRAIENLRSQRSYKPDEGSER